MSAENKTWKQKIELSKFINAMYVSCILYLTHSSPFDSILAGRLMRCAPLARERKRLVVFVDRRNRVDKLLIAFKVLSGFIGARRASAHPLALTFALLSDKQL